MIGKRKATSTAEPLRIGYARFFHEANSFSPHVTPIDVFEPRYLMGAGLEGACALLGNELPGVFPAAELSGFVRAAKRAENVHPVGLTSAFAIPSGPLEAKAFEEIKNRLLEALARAKDLDGLYLALHGSSRVEGMVESPEANLVKAINDLHPDLPLAASFDLHANLKRELTDNLDVLTAYHSNPHWDLVPTGYRAGKQLIQKLRGETRPTQTWRKLPMILGGGKTIDLLEPMRSIFGRARALCRQRGVLDINIFMVHPFSNATDLGWSVHVATDDDAGRAEEIADEMAELLWSVRDAELPPLHTPEQAFAAVRKKPRWRRIGPVSLVDMADIVGTGSSGGNTHILADYKRAGRGLRTFLPLHDPAAITALADRGAGEEVHVVLDGTLPNQPRVTLTSTLKLRTQTQFGKTLLLDDGEIAIALTELPPLTMNPAFWRELGLSPRKADILVQKSFFHYRIYHLGLSHEHIGVTSAGPSSLENVRSLSFEPPVHPDPRVKGWRDFDAHHRGLSTPTRSQLSQPRP